MKGLNGSRAAVIATAPGVDGNIDLVNVTMVNIGRGFLGVKKGVWQCI